MMTSSVHVAPTLDRAWENMQQLVLDAGITSFVLSRTNRDSEEGVWPFEVEWGDRKALVWMPGLPLHQLKVPQHSVTYFVPRIMVDGNDWLWPYAVDALKPE